MKNNKPKNNIGEEPKVKLTDQHLESFDEFDDKKMVKYVDENGDIKYKYKEHVDMDDNVVVNKQVIEKDKIKHLKNKRKIAALSAFCSVAAVSAVAIPLIINALKKPGSGPGVVTRYKVKFVTGEGATSVDTQEVEKDKCAVEPKEPTKDNASFQGWYLNDQKFNFKSTPITKDIELIAHWGAPIVEQYSVIFHSGVNGKFEGEKETSISYVKIGQTFEDSTRPGVIPNEGFSFKGWTDANGKTIPTTPLTGDLHVYASYFADEKNPIVTLSTSPFDQMVERMGGSIKVRGTSSFESAKDKTTGKYKQFKDVKDSLPVVEMTIQQEDEGEVMTITYVSQYWSLVAYDGRSAQPEVPDDTNLDTNLTFYPYFNLTKPTTETTLTLEVKLNETQHQYIPEGKGSTKIEVKYDGVEENAKTFGEINKPEVLADNCIFNGYYKDSEYTTPWNNDDKITANAEIHVKMDELIPDIQIEFINPTEEGTHTYQWVGNKTIKVASGAKVSDLQAPTVYKDATANPNPAIGYTSAFYFSNWCYKDKDGTEHDLEDSDTIETSIQIYPKFEKKVSLKYVLQDGADPIIEYAHKSTAFKNVLKPEVPQSIWPAGEAFTGWKSIDKWNGKELNLTGGTEVDQIKFSDEQGKITENITPVYSEYCNTIHFNLQVYDKSQDKTITIAADDYIGNKTLGVVTTDAAVNISTGINKPIMSDKFIFDNNVNFNNEWQWREHQEDPSVTTGWEYVTSETVIPQAAKGAEKEYDLRPVVTSGIKITFDANGGEIQPWSGEEKITSVNTSSTTPFAKMYKPETIKDGFTFQYWATRKLDGSEYVYTEVSPAAMFTESTTLYAVYTTKQVQSIVNYKILQSDLDDKDYPTEPLNDSNTFSVSYIHNPEDSITFDMFGAALAKKTMHKLVGWQLVNESGEPIGDVDPKTVVEAGKPLNVYAKFEKDTGFVRSTIAPWQSGSEFPKYEIIGDNRFFIKKGETLPISPLSHQIDGYDLIVRSVGHKVDYWTDAEGNKIDHTTIAKDDLLNIQPHFVEYNKKVTFVAEDEETTISDPSAVMPIPYYDTILKYLDGEVEGISPPTAKRGRDKFVCWMIRKEIKSGTEVKYEYEEITKDTVIEDDLVLVPKFRGESTFVNSAYAYYYDEEKGQWAGITNCMPEMQPGYMKIMYDDQSTAEIEKVKFNKELFFGSQFKHVPDGFLQGCINYNNGGKPLNFPAELGSIGINVLQGCVSFNQEVTISLDATISRGSLPDRFVIGMNFMRDCYAFSKNVHITLKNDDPSPQIWPTLDIGSGFMYDCFTFHQDNTDPTKATNGILDLRGWQAICNRNEYPSYEEYSQPYAHYWNMSTSRKDSLMYTKGFVIWVDTDAHKTAISASLPDMDGSIYNIYRKVNFITKGE